METDSPDDSSNPVTSEPSAVSFASTLGLMLPSQTNKRNNNSEETDDHRESGSSAPKSGSDLDPEYLSHIHSVVSKTGFTSPQQIYETISSMSKDDTTQNQPSVYNMPANPKLPPLDSSKSSANQLESFLSIPTLQSSKDRGRRVELTLQEKVDLIQHSKGKSQRALAEIFGVGKSQVNLILKRKDEIIKMYAKGGHLDRKRLRLRADKDEINSLTLEWFMEEYKNDGVTLSGPLVQEKAKELAAKLGRTEFRASNGWLHSFCKRNNIGFNAKQGLFLKEIVAESGWPSQVMGGTESWAEDSGFDLEQEDEKEDEAAAKSGASDDNSEERLEIVKKQSKSCEKGGSNTASDDCVKTLKASCSTSKDRNPPPGKKFKRCELNLLEKVELLHQHSAGKPEKELSRMFGVGRSQVYSTLKRKAEILEAYDRLGNTNRKRLHSKAESDEINQLTWHWFKEIAKLDSVQISGPMLQAKAKEFANQLGRDDFKASNGWLDTFRKRHYIKFTTGQGFVLDPPENIPLESIFPHELEEPPRKRKKTDRNKKDKVTKRVDLTIHEKVMLIQQSEGKSQRQLATLFGVGKSQVHSILRRKDEILQAFSTSGKGSMKRMNNRAETDDVNRLTWQWFQEVSLDPDVQLTGVVVQTKAREIAKQLGRDDFKASNGWLDSFRRRNNIVANEQKHLVICDEKDILAWKDSLSDKTKEYDARDIFSVSEIQLFYTSMPETVTEAAKYQIKKKMQTQNVAVVLCCNILGEFQTPVVIGKQTPDRATLNIPDDLPVHWRWSSSTWSTVEFFTEWVASLDQRMGEAGRKIVLFVDRAPPDATEILLENVHLVCPPSFSSRLQPLSHGAVDTFKQKYLKHFLSALIKQTVSLNENISKVLSYVSVLDACTWINQAVKDIDPSVVAKAFSDCGFNFGFVSRDVPVDEQDEEYEALIKKVIESFARKPLSYYMGTRSEDADTTGPQNVDCSQSSSDGNTDSQVLNEASSENPQKQTAASKESSSGESTEVSGNEDENEDKDPSVDFSLDKFSPLGQSLYKSSRRATLEKLQKASAETADRSWSCNKKRLPKNEIGVADNQQTKAEVDLKVDNQKSTKGRQRSNRRRSHVPESHAPVLTSQEDARMAAESLRRYCVDNELGHLVNNVEAIIKEL